MKFMLRTSWRKFRDHHEALRLRPDIGDHETTIPEVDLRAQPRCASEVNLHAQALSSELQHKVTIALIIQKEVP